MKVKILIAALALAAAPSLAFAGCGWKNVEQTASQCEQGQTWDAGSQTCIAPVNS